MTLSVGTRIGPYETISHIGSGGMGDVYLARDTQLKRDVALKVLPDTFATDPDLMARFHREAEVLASLNHANIAHIYGIEAHALVMEYVDGQTLPCPCAPEVAIDYARQIAEALEYAHDRGVIHRDLKPANIKVTPDGVVKLLDFGLAKALDAPSGFEPDATHSPTLTLGATQAGVILGTAAYMSPEQANGKAADRRADIWSFGAVLFEMLAGTKAFDGESASDTLASVLKLEPDWKALPPTTPPGIRRLIERCLTKDRRQRLQAIGEARILLEHPTSDPAASPRTRTPVLWPALAGVLAIIAAALAFLHLRERPAPSVETTRAQIALGEGLTSPNFPPSAISPDGRKLAYFADGADGKRRLWIRALDSLETNAIAGSEIESFAIPIWSPDSRHIAYAADGKLRRIALAGGPPTLVCNIPPGPAPGASWNQNDVILVATGRSISRVPANGGTLSMVVEQGVFPAFLPDGRHFVYLGTAGAQGAGIYLGTLDAKPDAGVRRVLASTFAPVVARTPDGDTYLLFPREGTLLAQRFDMARLESTGEPIPIAGHVGAGGILGAFSASANGTLVYISGTTGTRMIWYDRRGTAIGDAGEGGLSNALSPDGTQAAVAPLPANGTTASNLWLVDLTRQARTRFTFGSAADNNPVWSADGSWIAFTAVRRDGVDLLRKRANGAGEEELLVHSNEPKSATSWSGDGRYLLFTANNPTSSDVWALPMLASAGARKPVPLLSSMFNESHAFLSPDSRWLAYISDESGRNELYVRPFAPPEGGSVAPEGKTLVSSNGAETVRWRHDGRELFYEAPDGTFMSVEVASGSSFMPSTPHRLFQTGSIVGARYWDVAADGKRFLVSVLGDGRRKHRSRWS